MNFLDSAHKFTVTAGNVQQIEFGNRLFFTTLATGLPVQLMEDTLAAGGALFGNNLVFPAISFHAECVVLMPKGTPAPDIQLRNDFDFGFVQGLRTGDIYMEYWGQVQANGRTVVHIGMPNTFEVDTDTTIKPFTSAASSRFEVRNVSEPGGQLDALKVSSDFHDHPLYIFPRTVRHTLPTNVAVPHFLRWVSCKREFQTIFCFRNKRDGSFTPISATAFDINYNHTVSYSGNGATPTVVASVAPAFPRAGSPSQIDATVRDIMNMAKNGSPLLTPAVLHNRLTGSASRTVTTEDTNSSYSSSFWI